MLRASLERNAWGLMAYGPNAPNVSSNATDHSTTTVPGAQPPDCSIQDGHQPPENPDHVQYPDAWLWEANYLTQPVVGIELDLKSKEAKEISMQFCWPEFTDTSWEGDLLVVKRIVRVQNKDLWTRYYREKQEMAQKCENGQVEERRLLHGTAAENIDSICKHGFQMDRHMVHGKGIGKGHYYTTEKCLAHCFTTGAIADEEPAIFTSASVAETSSKAGQRSSKENTDEDRDAAMTQSVYSTAAAAAVATEPRDKIRLRHYMLLCTVLTGRSVKVGAIYRKPLLVILGKYDSAYYESSRGDEYVVYNDSQVYPEYVIEYWPTEPEMFSVET